jgi:hypothetical protein
MTVPLKFLSESKLEELRKNVTVNRQRYLTSGFSDMERQNGWAIEATTVRVDMDALSRLDGNGKTSEADFTNSVILHAALEGMTPALAGEERIWARLCHIECINYCRARWLDEENPEKFDAAVRTHLFGAGRTGIRDDNSLSRLWWNFHIASIADPADPSGALQLILKTADIRSNFVERILTASRRPIARGIIRAMRSNPWISAREASFREFMKELNRAGGGIMFETMGDADIDALLHGYAEKAKARLS